MRIYETYILFIELCLTSRPPVEFSTDLKFRQTTLKVIIKMVSHEKNLTKMKLEEFLEPIKILTGNSTQ